MWNVIHYTAHPPCSAQCILLTHMLQASLNCQSTHRQSDSQTLVLPCCLCGSAVRYTGLPALPCLHPAGILETKHPYCILPRKAAAILLLPCYLRGTACRTPAYARVNSGDILDCRHSLQLSKTSRSLEEAGRVRIRHMGHLGSVSPSMTIPQLHNLADLLPPGPLLPLLRITTASGQTLPRLY